MCGIPKLCYINVNMVSDMTNEFYSIDAGRVELHETRDAHVRALGLRGRLQGIGSVATRTRHDSWETVDGLVEG